MLNLGLKNTPKRYVITAKARKERKIELVRGPHPSSHLCGLEGTMALLSHFLRVPSASEPREEQKGWADQTRAQEASSFSPAWCSPCWAFSWLPRITPSGLFWEG